MVKPSERTDSSLLIQLKKISRYLVAITWVNAILVFITWQFNITFLKQPFPTLVAMNPVTAMAFFFLGSSFFILDNKTKHPVAKSLGVLLLLVTMLVCVVRILNEFQIIGFQIDLTFFRDQLAVDSSGYGGGRMAASSATSFILLSLALIGLHVENRNYKAISNYVAFLVFLLTLFRFLGYLYQVNLGYMDLIFDPMALRTAVCFVLFSSALILYDSTQGYFSVIGADNAGGLTARLLIPITIFVSIIFGNIRLLIHWKNNISVESGVALMVFFFIILFFILILITSRAISKRDTLNKIAETKFQSILESAPDAIIVADATGVIQLVNAQTEHLFGYSRKELLGKKVEILIPQRFEIKHTHLRDEFFLHPKTRSAGAGIELYGKKKDGREFPVEISLSPLATSEGQLVSAAIRDITERKQADDEMYFLASIADNIQDPIISSDNDSRITRWNHAAERLLGWKSEEVIGKNAAEVLNVIYPDQTREQILTSFSEKGYWQGEVIYHTKSGKPVNVLATASKLKDANGNFIGNLILARDITARKKTEDEMRKANKRFVTIFNLSPVAKAITSLPEGRFLYVNDAFCKTTGYDRVDLIGKKSVDVNIISKEARDKLISRLVKQDGHGADIEEILVKPNGEKMVALCTAEKMEIDNQSCFTFALIDITARKKAEAALSKLNEELEDRVKERTQELATSEEFNRGIINSLNANIAVVDVSGRIISVNDTWRNFAVENGDASLKGTTEGTNYYQVCEKSALAGEPIAAEVLAGMKAVMAGKQEDFSLEYPCHSPTEQRWFTVRIVKFKTDEPMVVVAHLDVTARKKAEEETKESEERFRALIENNEGIISLTDEALNTIYQSPSTERIIGWTAEDLKAKGVINYFHPDDVIIVNTAVAEAINKPGMPQPYKSRYRHKNGHYIWLEGTVTKMPEHGLVKGIVFNSSNATERIELERLLQKANTLARIGSWEVDLLKGTVYWNDITRELHEVERSFVPDLASGINFYKEGPGRDLIKQKVQEAIELGKPWDVELQIITAKNNERWIRSIGETEFADKKCVRIYGSFQDIDKRKRTEIERERLSERLQLATQSAQLGLWDWDVKNNKLIWDEAMYRLYNLTENEFTTVYDGWVSRVHEEDRERVDNEIQLALANKKDYNPEFKIVWPDSSVHYINASGIIERDSNGNAVRMTGFNWDVTERKIAEKEIKDLNTSLELKVAQRTEELQSVNKELESFTYSVSHDLRAPLRAVNGYAKMLEEDYQSLIDDDGKRFLGAVRENAKQMGQLIDDLLAFSRLGRKAIRHEEIDMNKFVASIAEEFKITHPRTEIKIGHLHSLWGDYSLLKQVLVNYISNGVKYSSHSEEPVVEITSTTTDAEVIYAVADNGAGFDMKYGHKLFQVFQRLHSHEEFEGTGVGLAIVARIITKHGGKVWAEGEVNKGATFYFSIPKHQNAQPIKQLENAKSGN